MHAHDALRHAMQVRMCTFAHADGPCAADVTNNLVQAQGLRLNRT